MTREEIIKAINELPDEDRLALRAEISRGVIRTASTSGRRHLSIVDQLAGIAKPEAGTVKQPPDSGNGQTSLSQTLYGILQFEAGPPTDEEVKEIIADYLLKKYY